MITGDQILCHIVGDYILQSDWMASKKTSNSVAAGMHALTYCLPFVVPLYLQGRSFDTHTTAIIAGIYSTHFAIDRYRLARYVCWLKNFLAPRWIDTGEVHRVDRYFEAGGVMSVVEPRRIRNHPWEDCKITGYHSGKAAWLTTWLMIITDNTLHVLINGVLIYLLK